MAALSFHRGALTELPGGCLSAPLNEGRHSVHPLSSCKGGSARGAQETHLSSGTRVSPQQLPSPQMCSRLLHPKSIQSAFTPPPACSEPGRLSRVMETISLLSLPAFSAGASRRGASLDAQRAACWPAGIRRKILGLQQETLHHSQRPTRAFTTTNDKCDK